MKMTDKQLNLLADVIVKQVWDEEAYKKELNEKLEKGWQEFRKNKQYQAYLKFLKDNPQIYSISIDSSFFERYDKCSYTRSVQLNL